MTVMQPAVALLPPERNCCGTFDGSAHRVTCPHYRGKAARERDIEAHLVGCVKALGGEVRKVQWIGRRGAPDRFVMLPTGSLWVELKAPGKVPPEYQLREHERMRKLGQVVLVLDSVREIDLWFGKLK